MKGTKWLRILVLTFGSIIILSVVAIILILNIYKPAKDTVEFEIVKSLLQLLTVLILGQVLSLVVTQYNLNRQRDEARTEFQREILRRLSHTYIAIVKQRRLLRAKGLSKPYIGEIQQGTEVVFDSFDKQMQFINETAGEIKAIRQDIKAAPTAFSNPELLNEHVEKMEDYLRKLIKIYEQKLGAFSGKGSKLPLASLQISRGNSTFTLSDFVGKAAGSQFDAEFVESYYKVSKMVREDILM